MAIITISSPAFAGGNDLAGLVATTLHYQLITREDLLTDTAREYSVPQEWLYMALDNKPGLLEGVSLQRTHYIAYLCASLSKKVLNDDVVYFGQVGHLLLAGLPHMLRVRVFDSVKHRINTAMEKNSLSRQKAEKLISDADRNRIKWAKAIYHVDWQDTSLYDIFIDLEEMNLSDACQNIISSLEKYQTTPESQMMAKNLALSSEIRARIANHKAIEDFDIGIVSDGSKITINGVADSDGEADRVIQTVRETQGVDEINSNLRIRTSGVYSSR